MCDGGIWVEFSAAADAECLRLVVRTRWVAMTGAIVDSLFMLFLMLHFQLNVI